MNQGQLKELARQFYTVLGSSSYTAGLGLTPNSWTNGPYPWSASTNPADDYAVANIGEVKYLFSFNLSAPTNKVPNWWLQYYLGTTNFSETNVTPAGNGLTLLQAYQVGANPMDYYSRGKSPITPTLSIVAGNHQTSPAGVFFSSPLTVQVNGVGALSNAPVTFTVSAGSGLLSTTNSGSPTLSSRISLRTSSNGLAQVYLLDTNAGNDTIAVTAGTADPLSFSEIVQPIPATVPTNGLKGWFSAGVGVVTNTSGVVTGWSDQAGNFSVTQTNTNNAPVMVTNGVNGLPAVRFNGGNGFSNPSAPNVQNIRDLNGDMTVITVGCATNSGVQQYAVSVGGTTWGYAQQFYGRSMGYLNGKQEMDGGVGYYSSPAYGTNVPAIAGTVTAEAFTLDTNLTSVQFYRNGLPTVKGSVSGLTNIIDGFYLGTSAGGSPWRGDLAEVMIYNHKLTTNEWAQVNQYIGDKYKVYNQYATWPLSYSAAVQTEIAKYQLNKQQADNYQAQLATNEALASNNPLVPTSGLKGWFSAGVGVVTNTSGVVTGWSDQAGNFSVTQTNTNNAPVMVTNGVNGLPAVRFNGGNGFSNPSAPNVQNIRDLNGDMTVITVGCATNSGVQQYAVSVGGTTWGYAQQFYGRSTESRKSGVCWSRRG